MTFTEETKFRTLTSVPERARFLLDLGVTAKIDIDPNTLSPVWRACCGGILLPGLYTGTESEAILSGINWLIAKTK